MALKEKTGRFPLQNPHKFLTLTDSLYCGVATVVLLSLFTALKFEISQWKALSAASSYNIKSLALYLGIVLPTPLL